MKLNLLICSSLLFFSINLFSQSDSWNLLLKTNLASSSGFFTSETDSFYVIIGRSYKKFPTLEQGINLTKIQKSDSKVIQSNYYGVENTSLEFIYINNVFQDGNFIFFPMTDLNKGSLFIFKIDLLSLNVLKLKTIDTFKNYDGFFLEDFISVDNYFYILGSLYKDNTSDSHIIKVNKITNETNLINLENNEITTDPNCIIAFQNGILVSLTKKGNDIITGKIKFMFFSLNDELLWEYETNTNVPNWTCENLLQINSDEFFYVSTDPKLNNLTLQVENRFSVMRFNMKTQKSVWNTWWDEPRKVGIFFKSKIIQSKNDNEYLLMANDAVLNDTSNYTTGKIVKFNGDGKRIWQKTYYYHIGWAYSNDFYNIIPTSDQNYLVVGDENVVQSAWLIKIDEDGNILPIDTTTSTQNQAPPDISTQIKIYPNPASHTIIINQGEIADMTYTLIDMTGAVIQSLPMPHPHHNTIWDISDVPSGTYVISMTQSGKVIGTIKQVVVK